MQPCRIIYCSLTALYVSSDIFVYHQEHLNCNYSFWFYSRVSWSAAENDKCVKSAKDQRYGPVSVTFRDRTIAEGFSTRNM